MILCHARRCFNQERGDALLHELQVAMRATQDECGSQKLRVPESI